MDPIMGLIIKGFLVVLTIGGVFFSHKYLKMKQDNPIEEIIEKVVQEETGIDVDAAEKELEKDIPGSDDKK